MMTNDSSSDTSDFSTVPQDFIYVGLRNCEQNTRCLYIGTRFSIGGLLSTVCYSTVFHRFFFPNLVFLLYNTSRVKVPTLEKNLPKTVK